MRDQVNNLIVGKDKEVALIINDVGKLSAGETNVKHNVKKIAQGTDDTVERTWLISYFILEKEDMFLRFNKRQRTWID
jgi:hypothetical protein